MDYLLHTFDVAYLLPVKPRESQRSDQQEIMTQIGDKHSRGKF